MKKFIRAIILLALLQVACSVHAGERPVRIVSLTPAITEILFELGLGEMVVGVTNYCTFPEQARNKAKVGGYLDTNYEAIILLKPDLVIMSGDYGEEIKDVLDGSGIEHMTVNTVSVYSMLDSIESVGRRCGAEKKAEEITGRIREDIDRLRKKAEGKDPKRVMIVVGRNAGSLENIYIAGKNTFYTELLDIIGHENVFAGYGAEYIGVSIESILRMDPDVIIEILANYPEGKKPETIAEWGSLKSVSAVIHNRVYIFNEDYVSIPGPRLTLLLEKMEETL